MAQLDFKASLQKNSRPVPMTKQAYRRPELLRHGTLREITLAVGFNGLSDGHNCGEEGHEHFCRTAH